MNAVPAPELPPVLIGTDDVAIVFCPSAFVLGQGNHLRAALCLVCRKAIGGEAAGIIGVAALVGAPCVCGSITSDVYLVHASHLPMDHASLQAAIERGLQCPVPHQ